MAESYELQSEGADEALADLNFDTDSSILIDCLLDLYVRPEFRYGVFCMTDIISFIQLSLKNRVPFYVTGSMAEGMINGADFDTMYVDPKYVVINEGLPPEKVAKELGLQARGVVTLKTLRGCHKGYYLLKHSDGSFLSADSAREACLSLTKSVKIETDTDQVTIQGPSSQYANTDNVLCLKCHQWPKDAEEFFARKRLNNWPTQEMLDKIKALGCHVVPVAHRNSVYPQAEFRLSFSLPERYLARSFNESQARCYYLWKEIMYRHLKKNSDGTDRTENILCSYHFKTAMFWMCENRPAIFWNQNTLILVTEVLNEIENYLSKQSCPNFFLPENLMMDHYLQDQCEKQLRIIQDVKKNLSVNILQCLSFIALQDYIPPLLECIKKVHGKKEMKAVISEASRTIPGAVMNDSSLARVHRQRHLVPLMLKVVEVVQGYGKDITERNYDVCYDCIDRLEVLVDRRTPVYVVAAFRKALYRGLGYLMNNEAYSTNTEDPRELLDKAEDYYKLSRDMPDIIYDGGIAGDAYLAYMYYIRKDYPRAKEITQKALPENGKMPNGEQAMLSMDVFFSRVNPMDKLPPPLVQYDENLSSLMESGHFKSIQIDPNVLLVYIGIQTDPLSQHFKHLFYQFEDYFKQKYPAELTLGGKTHWRDFYETKETYRKLFAAMKVRGELDQ